MLVWPSGLSTLSSIQPTCVFFHLTPDIHPFFRVQSYLHVSNAHVKLRIKVVQSIAKKYFFVNILPRSSFLATAFGLFKNPIAKSKARKQTHPAHKPIQASPQDLSQMATDDWTSHGLTSRKKGDPESCVAICEFASWRSLRIMAWMVTGWIQDKNLNLLRKDIGVVPQKSKS